MNNSSTKGNNISPIVRNISSSIHAKTSFIVISVAMILALLATSVVFYYSSNQPGKKNNGNQIFNNLTGTPSAFGLEKFKSCDELYDALEDYTNDMFNNNGGIYSGYGAMESNKAGASDTTLSNSITANPSRNEYSNTNNQVENVDEGDIVKTDGNFIFTANGRNINITEVDGQTGKLSTKSKISLVNEVPQITTLNLYQNKLVAIGAYSGRDQTRIFVYDISDKTTPKLDREIGVDGYSLETRMVDGVIYIVSNYSNYQIYPFGVKPSDLKQSQKEDYKKKIPQNLPGFYDSLKPDQGLRPLVGCEDLKYIRPIPSYNFVNLISLNLNDVNGDIGREVILGSAQTIYASNKNIYLAQPNYYYFNYRSDQNWKESTTIFKFNLEGIKINYQTAAEVEGSILNQFSMDEYDGNFRVATNKQSQSSPGPSIPVISSFLRIPNNSTESVESNAIYILDNNMKMIGSLTGLAPKEKIYSTRFMGKKGYMVTFKKTDPLFTFDLSDPKNPKVLGELKIPGYSDYLHPIDESTLIGVGKNASEAVDAYGDELGFAWYQGLKIGLFDVSDMANPKEIAKVEIGDRGTDSYVLQDHKAFLYDERNKLMILPVTLMVIPDDQKARSASEFPGYGTFKYQGSYVYNVSKENGFQLKGRVSHIETKAKGSVAEQVIKKLDEFGQVIETTVNNSSTGSDSVSTSPSKGTSIAPDYNTDYLYYTKRQMYINQFLITVSDKQIQSNKIGDLKLVNNLSF